MIFWFVLGHEKFPLDQTQWDQTVKEEKQKLASCSECKTDATCYKKSKLEQLNNQGVFGSQDMLCLNCDADEIACSTGLPYRGYCVTCRSKNMCKANEELNQQQLLDDAQK
jgi:hypothetical protein